MEEIRIKFNTPYKLILEQDGVEMVSKVISVCDQALSIKRTRHGLEYGDLQIDQSEFHEYSAKDKEKIKEVLSEPTILSSSFKKALNRKGKDLNNPT